MLHNEARRIHIRLEARPSAACQMRLDKEFWSRWMLYPVMSMDLLYTLSQFSVTDWLLWGLTILSLIGTVMNVRKMQDCFYIWAFTNAIWSIHDYSVQEYQQASLFFIYFILALWGIYEWRARKYVLVKEGLNDRDK
jgi:hypothetical protein